MRNDIIEIKGKINDQINGIVEHYIITLLQL